MSERELDKKAVQAVRELLVVRSRETSAPDVRGVPAESPDSQSPCEPPRLELSAPDIRRAPAGWRARCIHKRGVDSRHVKDARYGGYVGSFIRALDFRDRFHRERGVPIPWEIAAVVDGKRVAPEVVWRRRALVVRWQGQEHVVSGEADEIALDLFVEHLDTFRDYRAGATSPPAVGPKGS